MKKKKDFFFIPRYCGTNNSDPENILSYQRLQLNKKNLKKYLFN